MPSSETDTFYFDLLVTLHVTSNLVWIGSILAVGWLLFQTGKLGDAKGVGAAPNGALAAGLYRTVAAPAFVASFCFGLLLVLHSPAYYMHLHWFHAKLTAVLAVIALHHVLGAKAKRVASGSMQAAKNSAILAGSLLACAVASVAFVIFQKLLVP
jgi:putative membrane protein